MFHTVQFEIKSHQIQIMWNLPAFLFTSITIVIMALLLRFFVLLTGNSGIIKYFRSRQERERYAWLFCNFRKSKLCVTNFRFFEWQKKQTTLNRFIFHACLGRRVRYCHEAFRNVNGGFCCCFWSQIHLSSFELVFF